ncbi:response regulator [Fusibacter tunisiensis]|uniref:Stage 0 sporulation protein A homolog n=1 Tax=Fusibacter tunisiensis TaxID=1008308 RepID=A0ABS2MT35_9FIRM|nr:response regulator [Fusibacter tunisiensis]MBM7562567.1 two-component system response regulator YcbB [Fusibacter tunisiensis]
MNYNFYIVDDDKSIVSMLSRIIVNQNLGDVVGKAYDGEQAIQEIPDLKPDIVLVDLLLPNIDGITLVSRLKLIVPDIPVVMISEVYAKEMVSKAYSNGVEFFMNKPINVIEVINVIKRIDEKIQMKKIIHNFHNAFKSIEAYGGIDQTQEEKTNQKKSDRMRALLKELGLVGESGSRDLTHIIEFIIENKATNHIHASNYKLSDFYMYLSSKYEKEYGENVNEKTIEQRIRRTVGQALENMAEFGLEDYENLVFQKYASLLFEFKEVRREMDYIKGNSSNRGKINIKKFIIGIVNEVENKQI